MGAEQLVDALLGVVLAAGGWWVNSIWKIVMSQQEQITQLNVKLAENYVPRAEIDSKLDRIINAIETLRVSQYRGGQQ